MAIVVVGGHSRNVGKTSVVEGLIRGIPEARWTALKVTPHAHGACPVNCETAGHAAVVTEEHDRQGGTDSSRYLSAGAVRSLWVVGDLAAAMPRIQQELSAAQNAIVESNSILRFLKPDLYLSVLSPEVADFKDSARLYLDRADAVLVPQEGIERAGWKDFSLRLPEGIPVLAMRPPEYVTAELLKFLRLSLGFFERF